MSTERLDEGTKMVEMTKMKDGTESCQAVVVIRKSQGRRPVNNSEPPSDVQRQKLEKLVEFLHATREREMTGYIKINFNLGNICKIEKYEEILKK